MRLDADFLVTVRLGERERQITVHAIARVLGTDVAATRGMLFVLLREASGRETASYPQGVVAPRDSASLRERNESINFRSLPTGTGSTQDESARAVDNAEGFADYLADVFRDEKSLAFYKLVTASVPREVVRDALQRALDVPRPEVRRSRAAIFTALIRPHLPPRAPRSSL